MSSLLEQAILNNANWCELVVSTHGAKGRFEHEAWICESEVPPFYPNLITLADGIEERERQLGYVEELERRRPNRGWGVKDSFARLDLHPFGMNEMFSAQWMGFVPEVKSPTRPTRLRFEVASSPEALWDWEAAWCGSNVATVKGGLFRPSLLEEENMLILSGRKEGVIECGMILNHHAGAVGISNVFAGTEVDPEELIRSALHESVKSFRFAPVVSYVRDEEVSLYEKVGFKSLGPLTVWASRVR